MKFRRIIAAAVSTVALLAVNVGMADSAAARGTGWSVDDKVQQSYQVQKVWTAGTGWS